MQYKYLQPNCTQTKIIYAPLQCCLFAPNVTSIIHTVNICALLILQVQINFQYYTRGYIPVYRKLISKIRQ